MAKNKNDKLEYIKNWNMKHAQLSFRLDAEIKQSIVDHANKTGESIAAFVIRACKNQMRLDDAGIKLDSEK